MVDIVIQLDAETAGKEPPERPVPAWPHVFPMPSWPKIGWLANVDSQTMIS